MKIFFKPINRNGFGLVEILLFLVLVMFMTIILITSASSLNKTRRVNLEAIASQIASREIESLRNIPFANLPQCPQPAGCALSDTTDLSKLPAGLGVKFIESNFEENNAIKPVTVRISWQDNGVSKQISFDTLISENGL